MAEQSGFFDAHIVNGEYDRVYLAEHFARYFASFIGNGIFGGKSSELMVQQKDSADMSVRVLAGQGFINGYFYENTDELSLAIDNADGVLNRIDLIVLRWNKYNRAIRIAVEKGVSSSSPSAPLLKRNDDYYDLELARVYVKAGATRITQADITDMRLDSNVCGFVTGVIEQFDTTELGIQLDSFIQQYSEEYIELLNQYAEIYRTWFEEFQTNSNNDVNTLMAQLKEIVEANDLDSIISDIQELKSLAIESTDHPGCYYKYVNGEVEWINPPNEYGVEYRLTERWKGRPVFKETIFVPSLPSNSYVYIQANAYFEEAFFVGGQAFFPDDAASYPFPVYKDSNAAPTAFIHRVENSPVSLEYKGSIGIKTTDASMDAFSAEITLKYVKHGI